MRRDPRLAVVIKRCRDAPDYPRRIEHFAALVRVIVGQQLSTKAAQTIYSRVAAAFPDGAPTPGGFAAILGRGSPPRRAQPSEDRVSQGSLHESG